MWQLFGEPVSETESLEVLGGTATDRTRTCVQIKPGWVHATAYTVTEEPFCVTVLTVIHAVICFSNDHKRQMSNVRNKVHHRGHH